jgi:hypothetical protein
MKFDDFLVSIGDWGRYQRVKYFIICLSYMLPSMMVYTYSFTAATPSFRCQRVHMASDDRYDQLSNRLFDEEHRPTDEQCRRDAGGISLRECQRCLIGVVAKANGSESTRLRPCSAFVYDRTFYRETLTEQVIRSQTSTSSNPTRRLF